MQRSDYVAALMRPARKKHEKIDNSMLKTERSSGFYMQLIFNFFITYNPSVNQWKT